MSLDIAQTFLMLWKLVAQKNSNISAKHSHMIPKRNSLIEWKSLILFSFNRNFYESDDPQRLANKPNHRGYSPLYIACKNANFEVNFS